MRPGKFVVVALDEVRAALENANLEQGEPLGFGHPLVRELGRVGASSNIGDLAQVGRNAIQLFFVLRRISALQMLPTQWPLGKARRAALGDVRALQSIHDQLSAMAFDQQSLAAICDRMRKLVSTWTAAIDFDRGALPVKGRVVGQVGARREREDIPGEALNAGLLKLAKAVVTPDDAKLALRDVTLELEQAKRREAWVLENGKRYKSPSEAANELYARILVRYFHETFTQRSRLNRLVRECWQRLGRPRMTAQQADHLINRAVPTKRSRRVRK